MCAALPTASTALLTSTCRLWLDLTLGAAAPLELYRTNMYVHRLPDFSNLLRDHQ